jgi:hypothetical protein
MSRYRQVSGVPLKGESRGKTGSKKIGEVAGYLFGEVESMEPTGKWFDAFTGEFHVLDIHQVLGVRIQG